MTDGTGVIPLSYYTGVPNVGDLANADLVSAIGGAPSYQTRDVHLPHLLAVGSVMEWAQPSSIIWGAGVMDPVRGIGGAVAQNIHAVRGALSLTCLHDHGISVDVPLGDPAFLLPRLLKIERKSVPGRIGIVPHYVNQGDPFFADLVHQGAQLLDVKTLKVRNFLEEMATCACVISSSLHGLIFAEALGVPNLWVASGDGVHGNGFKFRDWFSTMRRPQREALRPQGASSLNDLSQMCETHEPVIDEAALMAAFPEQLQQEAGWSMPDHAGFRTVDACRDAPVHLFVDISAGVDAKSLGTTITSALSRLDRAHFVIVGGKADAAPQLDCAQDVLEYRSDHANVDAAFMKAFYDPWAEPQRHAIVEAGFDFSDVDIAEDLDRALLRQPHLEAIILDRDGRRAIYRRPGRWW